MRYTLIITDENLQQDLLSTLIATFNDETDQLLLSFGTSLAIIIDTLLICRFAAQILHLGRRRKALTPELKAIQLVLNM